MTVIIDLRHFNLFQDIDFENLLSPTGFGAVETTSEASSLTNGSQEHNQVTFSIKQGIIFNLPFGVIV